MLCLYNITIRISVDFSTKADSSSNDEQCRSYKHDWFWKANYEFFKLDQRAS